MTGEVPILLADTATALGPAHAGAVLICGSHGGRYAGYLAAMAGVRAVILHDAGVGLDRAGIGSLADLDPLGIAAATVAHDSARIGDAEDIAARGRISHVNRAAARLGCRPSQPARACAEAMRAAGPTGDRPARPGEGRYLLHDAGPVRVWGLDSASLARPEDAGQVIVCGSHGALLKSGAASAFGADSAAVCFNDAGVGADEAGISRLPALDRRGIIAATVACRSARIGDARSMWQTGILSHANDVARAVAVLPGITVRAFAERVLATLQG